MIRHIVLFQLKENFTPTEKKEIMEQFRFGILALQPRISEIRSIEIGFNVNTDEHWDICLNSSFDTLSDMHKYATHPLHLSVVNNIKPHLQGRSCTDYEF
ncbi:MAG: Dabb family protein [Bacteroidaceae bacterium]